MSLTTSKLWPLVQPGLCVEYYDRDTSRNGTRYRIELRGVAPHVLEKALRYEQPCVSCGRLIHPFRCRQGKGGRIVKTSAAYYAATCDLAKSIRCSRMAEASQEYARVRAAIEATPKPPAAQGVLPL